MSLEQFALIKKDDVPSREIWQKYIDALGFDFQLDPELKPFEDSGYLPCILNGNESGFEIYYEAAAEIIGQFAELKSRIGDRDFSISFRWGGDMAELASVVIASAALVHCANAFVLFEDGTVYELDGLIKDARNALEEI